MRLGPADFGRPAAVDALVEDADRLDLAAMLTARHDSAANLQTLLQSRSRLFRASLRIAARIHAVLIRLLGFALADDRTRRRRRLDAAFLLQTNAQGLMRRGSAIFDRPAVLTTFAEHVLRVMGTPRLAGRLGRDVDSAAIAQTGVQQRPGRLRTRLLRSPRLDAGVESVLGVSLAGERAGRIRRRIDPACVPKTIEEGLPSGHRTFLLVSARLDAIVVLTLGLMMTLARARRLRRFYVAVVLEAGPENVACLVVTLFLTPARGDAILERLVRGLMTRDLARRRTALGLQAMLEGGLGLLSAFGGCPTSVQAVMQDFLRTVLTHVKAASARHAKRHRRLVLGKPFLNFADHLRPTAVLSSPIAPDAITRVRHRSNETGPQTDGECCSSPIHDLTPVNLVLTVRSADPIRPGIPEAPNSARSETSQPSDRSSQDTTANLCKKGELEGSYILCDP